MQYRAHPLLRAAIVLCLPATIVCLLLLISMALTPARPLASASTVGVRRSCEQKWRVICLLHSIRAEITFRLGSGDDSRTFGLRDVIDAPKSKAMTLLSTTNEWAVAKVKLHPRFTTDTILGWCEMMGEIESIDLAYCYDVSDDGIASVSRIKGLKKVFLSDNNPVRRNNFVPHRFDLRKQKRLSDKTLYYLAQCATLEELYAYDIRFTHEGLKSLYDHPSLRVLELRGVEATDQEVAELRVRLPNCRVDITTSSKKKSKMSNPSKPKTDSSSDSSNKGNNPDHDREHDQE